MYRPEDQEKENNKNDVRYGLQTAQKGRRSVLVLPGTLFCHACVSKADHTRSRRNPDKMTALSGSPYLSSGTAFLTGEAVFCFSKDRRCRQQGCFGNFRLHAEAVSCTFWKVSYAPGGLIRPSDAMAACQILILDLQIQIL